MFPRGSLLHDTLHGGFSDEVCPLIKLEIFSANEQGSAAIVRQPRARAWALPAQPWECPTLPGRRRAKGPGSSRIISEPDSDSVVMLRGISIVVLATVGAGHGTWVRWARRAAVPMDGPW